MVSVSLFLQKIDKEAVQYIVEVMAGLRLGKDASL